MCNLVCRPTTDLYHSFGKSQREQETEFGAERRNNPHDAAQTVVNTSVYWPNTDEVSGAKHKLSTLRAVLNKAALRRQSAWESILVYEALPS